MRGNFERNILVCFVQYICLIRSDDIQSCHLVMLQCTPPIGHVVTFHLHSLGVNQEKKYTLYQ